MRRCTPLCMAALCAVTFAAMPANLSAAEDQRVETRPDGTRKSVYGVDAQGRRHGVYREFYPDGKPSGTANFAHGTLQGEFVLLYPNGKAQRRGIYREGKRHGRYTEHAEDGSLKYSCHYNQGVLHGTLQRFEGNQPVQEQFWLNGKLILPQSAQLITRRLAALQQAAVVTVGETPRTTQEVRNEALNPASQERREEALRLLMGYRFLCGVPYADLQLDRGYIAHAVAAARIMDALGELTHNPKNPGWPGDAYQFAAKGCGSSNISSSTSPPDSVKLFMGDSDPGNIDRLGHRRWCLNPAMQRTGFGSYGGYTAMWSFDSSRAEVPDYDFVAFPPQGLMPKSMFVKDWAWSVSLNPKKYTSPAKEPVKVSVTPVQLDTRSGVLQKGPQALAINYFNVETSGFGIPNCIIFRPADIIIAPNALYAVQIAGLQDAGGQAATLEYVAGFF